MGMGKAALFWAAASSCALAAVSSLSFADPGVAGCVRFGETKFQDQKRIEFRLENSCSRSAACSIAWEVSCEGAAEKSEAQVTLSPQEAQTFLASASTCDGRWKIGAPNWNCKVTQ